MGVTVKYDKNVAVVSILGEFSGPVVPKASLILGRAITEKKYILVDLTEVTFIDSSALGCLVKLRRDHRTVWGPHVAHVRLAVAPGEVQRVLSQVQFDKLFRVYETVADGLGSFPRARILIIEEDKDAARILEIMLEGQNYETVHRFNPTHVHSPDDEMPPFQFIILGVAREDQGLQKLVDSLRDRFKAPVGILTIISGLEVKGAKFVQCVPYRPDKLLDTIRIALSGAE